MVQTFSHQALVSWFCGLSVWLSKLHAGVSKLSYAGSIQGFFVDESHINKSGENQMNRGRKKKNDSEERSKV